MTLLALLVGLGATAEPPTRAYADLGAPVFMVGAPGGAEGNFVIGPDYPAPSMAESPEGKLQQFTMDSKDSRFYPGVGRDVFGTVVPDNPRTLIIKTHPQPYQRTITVYIPMLYKAGSKAPFIVIHDGPMLGDTDTTVPRILECLIAQRRVPAMIAIMIQNGGREAKDFVCFL